MPDIWFYSNSENMDKFIGFDEKIMSWYSNNTEYLSLAVNGWFDSDAHNCFSNEILKDPELKSKNLNSKLRDMTVYTATNQFFYDVIYNPKSTNFLDNGKK